MFSNSETCKNFIESHLVVMLQIFDELHDIPSLRHRNNIQSKNVVIKSVKKNYIQ